MTLTKDHIQQLYRFTEKHYVDWYDVQTELVDHLANGIEAQWKIDPKLSFDEALKVEFNKFGVMGFSDVVEQKTKALGKHYWRLIWKNLLLFFKLPKISLTLILVCIYFGALQFSMQYHTNWIVLPTLTLLFGFPWYFVVKEYKKTKRLRKETGKKWLLDHTISQLGGLVHLMNIGIYFQIIYQNKHTWSIGFSAAFSVCVVIFGMLLYVAVCIVTPKLRKDMSKQHPDYKFT